MKLSDIPIILSTGGLSLLFAEKPIKEPIRGYSFAADLYWLGKDTTYPGHLSKWNDKQMHEALDDLLAKWY